MKTLYLILEQGDCKGINCSECYFREDYTNNGMPSLCKVTKYADRSFEKAIVNETKMVLNKRREDKLKRILNENR